jgi:hypothetical protein
MKTTVGTVLLSALNAEQSDKITQKLHNHQTQGHEVYIYFLDDGVECLQNPILLESANHRLACTYACHSRNIPFSDNRIVYCGLGMLGDMIFNTDIWIDQEGSEIESKSNELLLIMRSDDLSRILECTRVAGGLAGAVKYEIHLLIENDLCAKKLDDLLKTNPTEEFWTLCKETGVKLWSAVNISNPEISIQKISDTPDKFLKKFCRQLIF